MGKVHTVVVVLFILALTCPSRKGTAHAQNVSSVADVDQRGVGWIDPRRPLGVGSIADPCQDPSTPSALREALRLVCSREVANRGIRKAIILGFVGGFVRRDDVKHPEVAFATYLRSRYGSAVHVEIFGNHEGREALEDTIRGLDTDGGGFLTAAEKEQVKIILYGHSWGASQTLTFARELQRRGIPVALTIQIDSVRKFGQDDRTVPANVAKAVNFYERKGLTPGQPLIVPADAARTKILGNFHMKYKDHQVKCDNYPWLPRVLNKPHHQIENDPQIWDQIASLIDSELLRTDSEIQAATFSESPVLK
jgi:pimeloyl-ACP methyl ester carboxylesterase